MKKFVLLLLLIFVSFGLLSSCRATVEDYKKYEGYYTFSTPNKPTTVLFEYTDGYIKVVDDRLYIYYILINPLEHGNVSICEIASIKDLKLKKSKAKNALSIFKLSPKPFSSLAKSAGNTVVVAEPTIFNEAAAQIIDLALPGIGEYSFYVLGGELKIVNSSEWGFIYEKD
ncbi:MAG: hypothetical protein LBV51_03130 [Acholeplasmatales bacterium]|jgi:hypothetical protein|nr:hypothetical protein [Acholeplasmatales bacterium]